MRRTSTELEPLQPTGRTSPVASTRSSLRLGFRRQRADLVEQQGAAVGLDHPADPLGEGAGEGAGDMAEQFAVDDVGGDRLAVDLDQRAAGAQAGVRGWRGRRFPCRCRARRRSGSAGGCARPWRRPPARRGNRARRRPAGRATGRARSFRTTGASSPCGAAAVGMGGERLEQPLGRDRLGEEIDGAGAHRLDRERDRAAVGEHDDRQVGRGTGAARRSAPGPSSSSQLESNAARTSRPCGPCSRPTALSAQAAPTTLQPARDGDRRQLPPLVGVGIDQQQ